MRLFCVDDGGATYWVLSETGEPSDLQIAIEEAEGFTFASEKIDPITADDVREVFEAEARATICRGDCEPNVDMWTASLEHQRTGYGRVVACSEWP